MDSDWNFQLAKNHVEGCVCADTVAVIPAIRPKSQEKLTEGRELGRRQLLTGSCETGAQAHGKLGVHKSKASCNATITLQLALERVVSGRSWRPQEMSTSAAAVVFFLCERFGFVSGGAAAAVLALCAFTMRRAIS